MEAMRTEFNNEMERLEQENSLLKERLKGEESQKGILEKEIRERENEVIGVRNELTKLKGEMFKCPGGVLNLRYEDLKRQLHWIEKRKRKYLKLQ